MIKESFKDHDESIDVGFIERCIEFVQYAKGTWAYLINSEQQRHRGHGLFTTGEQGNTLQLFSGRTRNDIDATLQDIFVIVQFQISHTSIEYFSKHRLKIFTNLIESLDEHLSRLGVNAVNHRHQFILCFDQIIILLSQELVTLLGLFIFLDSHQIYWSHAIHFLLKSLNPLAH